LLRPNYIIRSSCCRGLQVPTLRPGHAESVPGSPWGNVQPASAEGRQRRKRRNWNSATTWAVALDTPPTHYPPLPRRFVPRPFDGCRSSIEPAGRRWPRLVSTGRTSSGTRPLPSAVTTLGKGSRHRPSHLRRGDLPWLRRPRARLPSVRPPGRYRLPRARHMPSVCRRRGVLSGGADQKGAGPQTPAGTRLSLRPAGT
jgi:hypothetical protein